MDRKDWSFRMYTYVNVDFLFISFVFFVSLLEGKHVFFWNLKCLHIDINV